MKISKSGIAPQQQIKSEHITRIIDALSGETPNTEIQISGSITASYFIGDGSLLTNIPLSGSNFDSSSLATTGSNTFQGDQYIDGKLSNGGSVLTNASYSHAEGQQTTTNGIGSHAEGLHTKTNNFFSHAEGYYTNADGSYSHAEGYYTTASGFASHTEGFDTRSSGSYSHAEGIGSLSLGDYSHAEGFSQSSGTGSHAEGNGSQALGDYSHAEGEVTATYGISSHAEGLSTIAISNYQHVQGIWNLPISGAGAFIIGNGVSFGNESNLIYASGSHMDVTGSVNITNILSLKPQNPLPTSVPVGSFAVSSSIPPKPYFWDGKTWNALF